MMRLIPYVAVLCISGINFQCSSNYDCTKGEFLNNVAAYNQGYDLGVAAKTTGSSLPCEVMVDDLNYEAGVNRYFPTDCFCQGYDDGFEGSTNAYSGK